MQLNSEQLKFLDRLGKSPDGHQLRQLLKMWTDEANVGLRTKSGDHLMREQGRAGMLDDLTGYLEGRLQPPTRDLSRHQHFQAGPRD